MIDSRLANEPAGTIDLYDFDLHHSKIALGLFVAEKYRAKGYASQALQLTEDYVFNFLKINQLYAFIAEYNRASRRLFEHRNYCCQAHLKEWVKTESGFEDVFVYQKFRVAR
jgi:diamine N-acetyltransferase